MIKYLLGPVYLLTEEVKLQTFLDVLTRKSDWLNKAVEKVDQLMEKDGGHDWGHLSRVLSQAILISESAEFQSESINRDVLIAAVLFHDVVNLPKNSPHRKDASRLSADVAADFFSDIFNENEHLRLRNAIEAHSFSAGIPIKCDEAKIVQDADRLESVGALAIARTFYVSGLMGSSLFHPTDPFGDIREHRDDRSHAVDHFYEKVFLLPALMNTEYAKALAFGRNAFVENFLTQLRKEISL